MRIYLVSVGQKMPGWVNEGYQEYAKRLPRECALQLIEVQPFKAGKSSSSDVVKQNEADRIRQSLPKNVHLVALHERGKRGDTVAFSQRLKQWLELGKDVAIVIGGADGLHPDFIAEAQEVISLSDMTFPHPLVRVIFAEQIYRAWSLLHNHPYHRA